MKLELNKLVAEYGAQIHCFVLMDNHYHLVVSSGKKADLGEIMAVFQKSVSRNVNRKAGRINHLFGGPYKGCLILNAGHFARVIRYVFRNPIDAGIAAGVREYEYSTFHQDCGIITCSLLGGFEEAVPFDDLENWINNSNSEHPRNVISKALRRTVFKLSTQRTY